MVESRDERETAGTAAAEKKRNENVGVGVVFALVGVALFLTLDSPWAGLPMLVVGIVLVAMGMRGSWRRGPRGADRAAGAGAGRGAGTRPSSDD